MPPLLAAGFCEVLKRLHVQGVDLGRAPQPLNTQTLAQSFPVTQSLECVIVVTVLKVVFLDV